MWTITDKQLEAIAESMKAVAEKIANKEKALLSEEPSSQQEQKTNSHQSASITSPDSSDTKQTNSNTGEEKQTSTESKSSNGEGNNQNTDTVTVVLPCEQIEVIQLAATVNKLIDTVLIEKYDLKTQTPAEATSGTKVLYGELFRLCVSCNREPDKKDIPKKILLDGVGYDSEKTVTIGGESCVVNNLTTAKSLCKLELKQDKEAKNKFYTNWMLLLVADYMGVDKLEASENYNYEDKKSEGVVAHTTTNAKFPEIKFSTEDSSGNIEPIISGINQIQASLSFYIYTRNYEEWVGINKKDKEFYEDFFIGEGTKVKAVYEEYKTKIEESYNDYYTKTEDEVLSDIEKIVETYAAKLWKSAVDDVKTSYDDRPLYWARNKMQVYLKRHPVFKGDIDFNRSIPNANTALSKQIKLFEELSRNYTGVDFSSAGDKKKVLISGYDPFILNPNKNGNILQANPSGCAALKLHGATIGDYFIQTFIFPVRYKDFDDGYVEEYFSEYVNTFVAQRDIIFTMSQGSPFRFDVDRFPCKNRSGYMDNMFRGNSSPEYNKANFKQLSEGKEFYETTLPYKKIVPDKNEDTALFKVYLNQTYNRDNGGDDNDKAEGTILRAKLENIQKLKSVDGSGSNYLSNEIFYRVAKIRTEKNPSLQTGHLHLPLIQSKMFYEAYQQFLVGISSLPAADQLIQINKLKEEYHNIDRITIDINDDIEPLIKKMIEIIEKV